MAQYTHLTSSAQLHNGPLEIYGIIVNSHSSGAIKLYDDSNTDTFTPITGTYTYATGSDVITFPESISCTHGCYMVLTNAQDITVIWQQLN